MTKPPATTLDDVLHAVLAVSTQLTSVIDLCSATLSQSQTNGSNVSTVIGNLVLSQAALTELRRIGLDTQAAAINAQPLV